MPIPDMHPPLALCLMGPTASGKTDLAVRLAERYPVEIISVDSALVYRGLDIGAAKPDPATLARAPHRLIDLIDPTEAYSAGRFKRDALAAMAEIRAAGRTPLLAGGTMLYFKALMEGLDELPQAAPALRAELEARAAKEGWPALHAQLAQLDPATAARLSPNDSQRIQRALELCLTTGSPMSALLGARAGANPADNAAAEPADQPAWRYHPFALIPSDREWLRQRINLRFRQMLDAGLVDELRGLRERHPLTPGLPAMRAVGYRQAWAYLEGEIDAAQLEAQGSAATRQLAKRQLTWLRGWPGVENLDPVAPDTPERLLRRVGELLKENT